MINMYRYKVNIKEVNHDSRPVIWPIDYPVWLSGETCTDFIFIGYFESESKLKVAYPEAFDIELLEDNTEVKFTERLQCPSWYKDKN